MRRNERKNTEADRESGINVRVPREAPGAAKIVDAQERADLIPLFRLLTRQPSADHDFRTCPICKRSGITEI
jgi:hypothetical protein